MQIRKNFLFKVGKKQKQLSFLFSLKTYFKKGKGFLLSLHLRYKKQDELMVFEIKFQKLYYVTKFNGVD